MQAGALYSGNDYFKGYSVLSIDEEGKFLRAIPPEFGATSFLVYLTLRHAAEPNYSDRPRIPLYIDIRAIRSYSTAPARALRNAHPDSDHPRLGWKALIADQPYAVLIDNFDPENTGHIDAVAALHAVLPKAKYIIAAKVSPGVEGLAVPKLNLPFDCKQLVLRPFTRNRVRQLVHSHGLPAYINEDALVEEIMQRFWSLGIPYAAPLLSMYILIRSITTKFEPINISSIVEMFVEDFLLVNRNRKIVEIDEVLRSGFDKKEQIGVLGYLAEQLAHQKDDFISYDRLLDVIEAHYHHIGIERVAAVVAHHFVSNGVLERRQNEVAFRYRIVQSYFTARRMQTNYEFREFILDKSRSSNFFQELDLYFGLNRADSDGVRRLSETLHSVTIELLRELEGVPSVSLDKVNLPIVQDLTAFQERLTAAILNEDEKHTVDEELDIAEERFRGRVNKPHFRATMFRWVGALRALSVAVRNAEEIPTSEKIHFLGKALTAWGELLERAVWFAGMCFKDGSFKIGQATVSVNIRGEIDGSMLRLLMANMPRIVALQAIVNLATAKLSTQLEKLEGQLGPAGDFVRVGLMATLRLKTYKGQIDKLVQKHIGSRFMLEALMWNLRDIYLRYGMEPEEGAQLRRLIAEVDATAQGLKGGDRDAHIAKSLQRYEKERLIAKARQ